MIDDFTIADRLRWAKDGNWVQGHWQHEMVHGDLCPLLSQAGWLALDLDMQLRKDIPSQAMTRWGNVRL